MFLQAADGVDQFLRDFKVSAYNVIAAVERADLGSAIFHLICGQ